MTAGPNTYDQTPNPLVSLEVALHDEAAAHTNTERVLDTGCGTDATSI